MLNAYFYGYLVTQVVGGWLAARHGGKWVFSVGMSVSIVATLLIPVGARLHVGVLIFLRVLIGAASVSIRVGIFIFHLSLQCHSPMGILLRCMCVPYGIKLPSKVENCGTLYIKLDIMRN